MPYSILFHFIPFYSILFHFIPFYSILFHFIPFYSFPQLCKCSLGKVLKPCGNMMINRGTLCSDKLTTSLWYAPARMLCRLNDSHCCSNGARKRAQKVQKAPPWHLKLLRRAEDKHRPPNQPPTNPSPFSYHQGTSIHRPTTDQLLTNHWPSPVIFRRVLRKEKLRWKNVTASQTLVGSKKPLSLKRRGHSKVAQSFRTSCKTISKRCLYPHWPRVWPRQFDISTPSHLFFKATAPRLFLVLLISPSSLLVLSLRRRKSKWRRILLVSDSKVLFPIYICSSLCAKPTLLESSDSLKSPNQERWNIPYVDVIQSAATFGSYNSSKILWGLAERTCRSSTCWAGKAARSRRGREEEGTGSRDIWVQVL